MFYTFFKGEKAAYQVYEMLLPVMTRHYLEQSQQIVDSDHPQATD